MQAFADALVAHGQRGVFLMIDMETGRFHLSGHLPDTDDKVVKILEDLIERLNSDLAATGIPTHRIGMRQ